MSSSAKLSFLLGLLLAPSHGLYALACNPDCVLFNRAGERKSFLEHDLLATSSQNLPPRDVPAASDNAKIHFVYKASPADCRTAKVKISGTIHVRGFVHTFARVNPPDPRAFAQAFSFAEYEIEGGRSDHFNALSLAGGGTLTFNVGVSGSVPSGSVTLTIPPTAPPQGSSSDFDVGVIVAFPSDNEPCGQDIDITRQVSVATRASASSGGTGAEALASSIISAKDASSNPIELTSAD